MQKKHETLTKSGEDSESRDLRNGALYRACQNKEMAENVGSTPQLGNRYRNSPLDLRRSIAERSPSRSTGARYSVHIIFPFYFYFFAFLEIGGK